MSVNSLKMSVSFHMLSAPETKSAICETANSGSSDSMKSPWDHTKNCHPQ